MLEGWETQCSCGRVEESKRLTAVSRFNGVNTGGTTAAAGKPKVVPVSPDGLLSLVSVSLNNSSLASQAVGPANNPVEMSFKGRNFPQLGKKLLHPAVVPLGSQRVATDDSSLGQTSNGLNKGLNTRYADMVAQAFQPRWWNSSQCVDADKSPVADSAGCPNSFKVMDGRVTHTVDGLKLARSAFGGILMVKLASRPENIKESSY